MLLARPVYLALLMLAAGPALAADCPADTVEGTVVAIAAAPSCSEAGRTYFACTRGTTQDVEFAGVAIESCENRYLKQLRPAQVRVYRQAFRACERRFAGEIGTMYRSFEASCRVKAALQLGKSR